MMLLRLVVAILERYVIQKSKLKSPNIKARWETPQFHFTLNSYPWNQVANLTRSIRCVPWTYNCRVVLCSGCAELE